MYIYENSITLRYIEMRREDRDEGFYLILHDKNGNVGEYMKYANAYR